MIPGAGTQTVIPCAGAQTVIPGAGAEAVIPGAGVRMEASARPCLSPRFPDLVGVFSFASSLHRKARSTAGRGTTWSPRCHPVVHQSTHTHN